MQGIPYVHMQILHSRVASYLPSDQFTYSIKPHPTTPEKRCTVHCLVHEIVDLLASRILTIVSFLARTTEKDFGPDPVRQDKGDMMDMKKVNGMGKFFREKHHIYSNQEIWSIMS